MFGKELALIIVDPPPTPVTGTFTVVLFALSITVDGTVATPVLLELMLITRSVESEDDRLRNNCWGTFPVIAKFDGENVRESVDSTTWLTGENSKAEAVMIAGPNPNPFTFGANGGVVAPPGMTTAAVTLTFDESLLKSVIKTPPAGAGTPSVMGKGADCPMLTVTFAGRMIPPGVLVNKKSAGVATPVTEAVTI